VDGQRLTGVDAFTCTWDAREVAALRPGDGPGLPQVRMRLAVPELAWDLIAPGTCELLDAAGWAKLVRGCRR